jgi:hypothetical protein
MTLPGFTAKSALRYDSSQYSENLSFKSDSAERIVPAAPKWGQLRREHCTRLGFRQYSAILWDIPWGESWERACRITPSPEGRYANRCINVGTHMWGQWDIEDTSCGFCWYTADGSHCCREPDGSWLCDPPLGTSVSDLVSTPRP